MTGSIKQIDGITGSEKRVHPSRPIIGCAQKLRPLPSSAVNESHRHVTVRFGYKPLDICRNTGIGLIPYGYTAGR
jgi:hypothetical protein